jgi:hypothetical protein
MANKKINELVTRTPSLSDLILVGDPSSGYSYKATVTALATIIETDIADGFVTIGTTQTISGAKTFSNNLTLTSVANTPTDPDKFLTLNASNVVTYRTGAEVLSDIGGQGALTLTTSGSSGAATLVGNNLNIPNYGSALSGYVPYTGATTNVNLASRYLQANYLVVDGQSNATAINFKQYSSVSFLGDGYTGMGSVSVDKMFFNFAQGSNIFKTFYFDVSAITGNATRAYIMPNADGTLALTSQIPTVSGTTNYVAKFTSSSAVGNSQIFDNGTNVGIGNASPAYKLDVSGSIYGTNIIGSTSLNVSSGNGLFLNNTGNTNYYTLYTNSSNVFNIGFGSTTPIVSINSSGNITANSFIKSGGTSSQYLMADGSTSTLTNPVTGTGTANYIPKFTSSSAIGNSIVQDNATGIIVNGTDNYISQNGGWFFNGSGSYTNGIFASNSSNNLTLRAPTQIIYEAGGSEGMRLTSTGLGIGTSSPTTKLDVNGDGVKFGNGSDFYFNANTGASGNYYHNQNGGVRYTISPAGNLGIGTSSPARKLDVSGTGRFTGDLTIANSSRVFLNGTTGQDWALRTNSSTGNFEIVDWTTELARITMTASGNLGLGVTPSATTIPVLQFGANAVVTSSNTTYLAANATFNSGWKYITSSLPANQYQQTNGGHAWFNAPSGTAGNAISFTQAMTLDASGNLAIGTTSTALRLNLASNSSFNAGVRMTSGANTSGFDVGLLAGTLDATAYVYQRANADMIFGTNNAERMRITSGGNVGIGTSAATEKLEVNGAIRATGAVTNNSTGAVLSYQGSSGSLLGAWGADASTYGFLRFYLANSTGTQGAEYMRLTTTGLGIGTTSPTQRLDVNGTIQGNNGFNGLSGATHNLLIDWSAESQVTTLTATNLFFGTNAERRMTITSGGNVGIGSSNPQEKFVVSNGSSLNIEINPSYIQSFNRTSATYNDLSFFSSTFIVNTGTSPTERMRITSGGELLINTTSDAGDYKLQVNGNGYLASGSYSSGAILYLRDAVATGSNTSFAGLFLGSSPGTDYVIGKQSTNLVGTLAIKTGAGSTLLTLDASGNQELTGSIKTAAPSGGTAKPWKLGEAGVTLGGSNTSGVRVEIDGTVYYLVTGYLP